MLLLLNRVLRTYKYSSSPVLYFIISWDYFEQFLTDGMNNVTKIKYPTASSIHVVLLQSLILVLLRLRRVSLYCNARMPKHNKRLTCLTWHHSYSWKAGCGPLGPNDSHERRCGTSRCIPAWRMGDEVLSHLSKQLKWEWDTLCPPCQVDLFGQ